MKKLVIEHLKKTFDQKVVLEDIDYTFTEGKIYGLLGRNGSGKTTLFNCLNEDLNFDDGKYSFWQDETEYPLSEHLGYVLSVPVVPDFLTGREFLKFFIDINKTKLKEIHTLDHYFELMHIDQEDRDKLIKDYSLGMKNKMQMLINIIADPDVLLLDEPLTSLDVVVAQEMEELLRQIKQERILILSTHIMELALNLCDEIVILNHGRLSSIPACIDKEVLKQNIIAKLKEE